MYFINSRRRINFSLLTFVVVLIVFISMSSRVLYSSAHSNDDASNGVATFTVTNTNDSGETFTVSQEGGCTYSLSATSANIDANGGEGSVNVTAGTGCNWTAVSNVPWILTGSTGTGNGTVNFLVEKTSSPRSGTLTIAGQTFTVTQTGCTLSISPSAVTLPAAEGRGSFIVRLTGGCEYRLQSTEPGWLGIIGITFGMSDRSFTFFVSSNTTGNARTGTIRVTTSDNTAIFTVIQESGCSYSLSAASANIDQNGGTGSVNVNAVTNCEWTSVSNVPWITITSGATGIGNGTVNFTVAANAGAPRSGTLTIAGKTFTVNQASGCAYTINPTSINISANGGNSSFNLTSGTGCPFAAVSNSSFITITSGASGTGNGTISFSVTANTTGAIRIGTITAGGQTFTISQAALPTLSINNNTLNEGNSGTTAFTFTVSLSAASSQTVTVNYATADGTAIAGEDYTAASGTITFAPGEVNKTLTVPVSGDTVVEDNETFFVNLSNASNATIAIGQGTGTILNDDAANGSIQFSLSNYTVNENEATAVITVTRTGGAASGVSVNYSTANGTATAGQDYTATSGVLTFAANETSKTFSIPIINDSINEPNETVSLFLTNAAGGATLGSPVTAVLTIIDDDAVPTLSINNVSANEGNSGTTVFNFTVSLSGASSQTVTVNYATANGTATSPADYQAASGSLSFAPGETGKTISVLVNGDTEVEPNETFTVNLTNAANATIANGVGTGTIQNDDSCSYSISPTSMNANANVSSGNTIVVTTQTGCAYTAASNDSFITITSGASGTGNGMVGFTVAANTGAARTGTLIIAGQTFTVNQATGIAARRTAFDFDGDGKADISVFRPDNGVWYLLNSTSGFTAAQFGISTDKIVPADYDGDGKTDVAVYRNGIWYLQRSQLGFTGIAFGDVSDIPQPGDFDGDGKAEIAVWRPSNGTWYVYNLVNNQFNAFQFGASTDKPVVGDYDGDSKADYAVFRPSIGTWYYQQSTAGFGAMQFGDANDKPVPADYDGDGKTDVAVFRPSNGVWYLQRSQLGFTGVQFGISTDLPTPADYDGDGKSDIAVFRDGIWYLQRSVQGFTGAAFGAATDKPIPNAFVP